jgi:hypothetical protein
MTTYAIHLNAILRIDPGQHLGEIQYPFGRARQERQQTSVLMTQSEMRLLQASDIEVQAKVYAEKSARSSNIH